MDFWKLLAYVWNAELLLLRKGRTKKNRERKKIEKEKEKNKGYLQLFKQLNFLNDTPDIK